MAGVREGIVNGDCKGVEKRRSTYHFLENSTRFALKTEMSLTRLSDFERERTLEDLAF